MKKISRFVLVALLASAAIDLTGFAFGLFYEGLFYDNLAHFLTTFSLMALASELYLWHEATRSGIEARVAIRHALLVGASIGLVGGTVWEGFESVLDLAFPRTIYNPPVDSVVDTLFGTAGGALGVWRIAASTKPTHATGYVSAPREKV